MLHARLTHNNEIPPSHRSGTDTCNDSPFACTQSRDGTCGRHKDSAFTDRCGLADRVRVKDEGSVRYVSVFHIVVLRDMSKR